MTKRSTPPRGFPTEEFESRLALAQDGLRTRARCHTQMLRQVDPDFANQQAFADQAVCIERVGGRDAVLNFAEFDFTPVAAR